MSLRLIRSVVTASALLTLSGLASAQAPAQGQAPTAPAGGSVLTGPQIVFDSERASFGRVLDTEPQVVKFRFRNVGGADLRLGEYRKFCDCVTVNMPSQLTYAPGESGEISVMVDPRDWTGEVGTVIHLSSNSPGEAVPLTAHGIVDRVVEASPKLARFGWVKGEDKKTVRVTLTGRTENFRINSVQPMINDWFDIKIGEPEPVPGEAGRARVVVEITNKGKLPDGELAETLGFNTNDPRKPRFVLPVSGWWGENPPPVGGVPPTAIQDGRSLAPRPVTPADVKPGAPIAPRGTNSDKPK
ncbi:MAG: DUF1573 domain-containing protein [Planctomycetes bacterium]|nr:DUF1573 domain-containing protein [Planctomycetota bacterium]